MSQIAPPHSTALYDDVIVWSVSKTLSADRTALLRYANDITFFKRPEPASTDRPTKILCRDHVEQTIFRADDR